LPALEIALSTKQDVLHFCGMRWRLSRSTRFAFVLVAALAALTMAALWIVQRTIRAWFERDIVLRSELALTGARRPIVTLWDRRDWPALNEVLQEVTHDERLLAIGLCGAGPRPVARTADYPDRLDCGPLIARLAPSGEKPRAAWRGRMDLAGGAVHVSVLPVRDGERTLGQAIVIHDLSYVVSRERDTRRFLLLAFAILAAAASLVTIFAARFSWRDWSAELWRHLGLLSGRRSFRPPPRDMRDLVEQLQLEAERDNGLRGDWDPQRLRDVLDRRLDRERIIILANREPYIHQLDKSGKLVVFHPASGLVTALEPVMRACRGVWVAHGSGDADRASVDSHDRVRVPPGEESYLLRRVWLTTEEERGYYYGFSNEGLWPLCHVAHQRPLFRSEDWRAYQAINRRFAEAAVAEADSDEPIILVQDYHFALAPRYIRERLPRAVIITFWHIPWPNSERYGICPYREQILEGLLGSSIIGFHTQLHCNNYLDAVDRFLEARIDREQQAVVQHSFPTLVRPYPISVEWPSRWLAQAGSVDDCRAKVRADLGMPADTLIGVGVDRLDYTKGIEERLLAVERLLERFPAFRGRFVFVQLAAPSRTIIEAYQRLDQAVHDTAARINERFGGPGYQPIVLHRAHHEPPAIYQFYRAADVCYVSSLHDGMNLVAKEFVSARDDERGVLVLSQFTGAARELTEALLVNPYDMEEASAALAAALAMPIDEQRARMQAMRSFVGHFNVYRWAGKMLVDAELVRRRGRFRGSWPANARANRPGGM
jgi:trehalose 6-phosphate synthase